MIDDKVSKILVDESKEIIKVSSSSYIKLLNMSGGSIPLIIVNIFMFLFMISKVYCDYLTATWAQSSP